MTHWALVCSPFLGPESWQPVVEPLRRLGHRATVVSAPADSPDAVLAGLLAGLPDDGDLVLVPHSNAGVYVAALAASADLTGVVFVDALLPGDTDRTPVAPPVLVEQLAGLVEPDGRLPVWTRWWPDVDVADLFPSPAVRTSVEAGQSRLLPGYLTGVVPTPVGWELLACAYLGFGETYADEQAIAGQRGWPVDVLPGRHLHQVMDPDAVADHIVSLQAASSA
ncbi:MAG: hypothetical protein ABI873_01705 [Marmoricola sp.]